MEEISTRPRVTALIVSRNCSSALQRCLEALDRSTERETLEILVVDNGSTDGSASVANDFPAVTVLRLPKNFGRAKALNIGLRTAKGDFVLLLDPGVEVNPDTISILAARLAADDSIGAVCPNIDTAYPLPSPSVLKAAWTSGKLPGESAIGENASVDYPKGAPMLVRRMFLKGMNYFDQRFGEHWTDLELCWQLRSAGKKILVLPDARVTISGEGNPPERETVELADSAAGIEAYLAKHYGSGTALGFRLSAILHALTRARLSLVSALVTGQKIDGTQ